MTSHNKTTEPFWWGLFSVGGVVAAFLVPIHLILNGLAIPLGWISVSPASMAALVRHPLVKIYLFVLIALPLYHWAHRFRFILEDLGLHGMRTPLAILCYGAAIVGTVLTIWVLLSL
ncbi:MAG TPA: fumarate reductase subunit FrdD [Candidatus Methylomirabilis sp.]|nr:fumarate reductase subunit FrdD [Candidatus Methylomirabilis sp.]